MDKTTLNQRVCGIDGDECDFRYRRYSSAHIMGDFAVENSECHRTGHPKKYPTHLHHCERQK